MASNIKNFDYKKFLRKNSIFYLNYITHINNLNSILTYGILSRNEVKRRGLNFTGLDWEEVQYRRRKIINDIHDFVPLYFATHTPMLRAKCAKERLQNEIAVLKIDLSILEKENVYFSNMNCACEDVMIYEDLSDLTKLRWKTINIKRGWWRSYKKYKSAEVLVKDKVDLFYIWRVYVANFNVKRRVDRMLTIDRKGLINVKPSEFYEDVIDDNI